MIPCLIFITEAASAMHTSSLIAALSLKRKGDTLSQLEVDLFRKDGSGALVPLKGRRENIRSLFHQKKFENVIDELLAEECRFLEREKERFKPNINDIQFSSLRLPPSRTLSLLQALATIAQLVWRQKPILFDTISSPILLHAIARDGDVELLLKSAQGQMASFPSSEVSFIMARPHLILYGGRIQRLHEDITWAALLPFLDGSSKVHISKKEYDVWKKEVEEECGGCLSLDIPSRDTSSDEATVDPLPVLRLCDTRGSLATLFMEYRLSENDTRLVPYIPEEVSSNVMGAYAAAKGWEADLLSVGFERRTFVEPRGVSLRYFCPTEKIDEALSLLLEVGWKILDREQREIARASKLRIRVDDSYSLEEEIELSSGAVLSKSALLAKMKTGQGVVGPFVQLGTVSLFLPGELRLLATELAAEIEVASCGKVSLHPLKKGIIEEFSSPSIELLQRPQSERLTVDDSATLFRGILRPYQEEGVAWMRERALLSEPCLLADEMGLGKTVQVLAWIAHTHSQSPRFLIVAPKPLLSNWQKECERFLPSVHVLVYQEDDRKERCERFFSEEKVPMLLVTSYHTLRSDAEILSKICFDGVIVDEAQMVKNAQSLGFKALSRLSRKQMILLTGTPLENSITDIWSLFHLMAPELLGGFCQDGFSRIKRLIRPFMLRRTKDMVAKELPPCIEETISVAMNVEERERYLRFLHSLREKKIYKSSKVRMEILEAMMRLRQMVCHHELFLEDGRYDAVSAKWELVRDDLQTLLSEGKKVLIFTHFRHIVEKLAHELSHVLGWKGVSYHGGMKNFSIDEAVDAFQNDPNISFFITTMKSGSAGLNITKADSVIIYDPWWNRAVEQQAIARAHRIGREGTVMVRRYVTHGSIEERVYEIAEKKAEMFLQLFSEDDEDISVDQSISEKTLDSLVELLETHIDEEEGTVTPKRKRYD